MDIPFVYFKLLKIKYNKKEKKTYKNSYNIISILIIMIYKIFNDLDRFISLLNGHEFLQLFQEFPGTSETPVPVGQNMQWPRCSILC